MFAKTIFCQENEPSVQPQKDTFNAVHFAQPEQIHGTGIFTYIYHKYDWICAKCR